MLVRRLIIIDKTTFPPLFSPVSRLAYRQIVEVARFAENPVETPSTKAPMMKILDGRRRLETLPDRFQNLSYYEFSNAREGDGISSFEGRRSSSRKTRRIYTAVDGSRHRDDVIGIRVSSGSLR